MILQTENLKKSFGKLEVLKGISTGIRRGEVVSIIGPSGGGKSTFLRCLNLLETPDEGKILFKGEDISAQKLPISKYRQSIGMVFQHFNVFPNMTVLQNIRCGIRSGSRAGKHGPRRETDRSVQHPHGQMPVLQVKVK